MKEKIVAGIMLTLLLVSIIDFSAVGFVAIAAGSEGGSIDWWFMFRHYENHTGYSLSNVTMPIVLLKNFTTGGAVRSSPAVVDDVAFVSSLDGYVYAWNITPPYELKWRSPEKFGAIYSSLAVVGGRIYVGSNDTNIYSLNATNGHKIWNYTTKDTVKSSPVVVDGVLYAGSCGGYFYALDASTGKEMWRFWTASSIESSPAVSGDTIIFGTNDGRVYALEKSGRYKWHFQTNGSVISSPVVADGIVFVGSNDTQVYALDTTTIEEIIEMYKSQLKIISE